LGGGNARAGFPLPVPPPPGEGTVSIGILQKYEDILCHPDTPHRLIASSPHRLNDSTTQRPRPDFLLPPAPDLCYNLAMRHTIVSLTLLFSLILTLTGCSITHVMRVEDHQVIGVESMIDELHNAPVILVGERHDAPSHHTLQLDIIKGLQAKGIPLALGMEMFETPSQQTLDAWISGMATEEVLRKVYESNWRNIPWDLYSDILWYARDNKIPLIALNAPRGIVQMISQHGASALGKEALLQLRSGINLQVSDDYLDFIGSAYPVHGRSGQAFRYICEAQMLRNRVMARRVSDYLALHPERTVVVIAGGGHAREKGGIPAELGKLQHRIVLPSVPGMDAETVSKEDADYLMEEPYLWLEMFF
jgi:uncharacterized iron-regulated protein